MVLIRDEVAALQKNMAEMDALGKLIYVNARGNQHETCTEGTRVEMLDDITRWATNTDAEPMIALIDQAGTGKSTISAHLARQWEEECALLSRFFFSKPMGITSAQGVATTLAWAMAARIPLLRSFIVKALEDKSISELSMEDKLDSLVFTPLRKLKEEREKALGVVREEIREKAKMEIPGFESLHETIRARSVMETLKKDYLDALNAVERDGRGEETLKVLETAYLAYLRVLEEALSTPLIIVFDALDECLEDDRSKLLQPLIKFLSSCAAESAPFKLFSTSRPEKDVMSIITDSQVVERTQSSLHLQSTPSNQDDITIYVKSKLEDLLTKEEISQVVTRADGLFIWAATAADFIINASDQLKIFHDLMESTLPDQPLDSLYTAILDDASKRIGRNEQLQFINVLKLICLAREPLTTTSMDELLNLRSKSGDSISGRFVAHLTSVLSDGRDRQAVQALHPTFIEFLLRWRWQDQIIITIDNAESLLAQGCLDILLSDKLKYDILDVIQPNAFIPMNGEIEDLKERIESRTTGGLRYAAVYALSHVASSPAKEVAEKLRLFFKRKLLFWIELMSYLGKIYPLLQSIHLLSKHMKEFIAGEGDNWVSEWYSKMYHSNS